MDRELLLNAYTPNCPIDEPTFFAGRPELIKRLADSLQSHGACPIIYGDRGVGKSSIAMQTARIAMGDVELLEDIGAVAHAIPAKRTYEVLYLPCSDTMSSHASLLRRLLSDAEFYRTPDDVSSELAAGQRVTETLDLKVYKRTTEKSGKSANPPSTASEEAVLRAFGEVIRKSGKRLLVIIDELDRLGKTQGLASFIKNNSSQSLKFILVGVSTNIGALLADHESLQRVVTPINVGRMAFDELCEISRKVNVYLQENCGVVQQFSSKAISRLAMSANGFPWLVHVIGRDALMHAVDSGESIINEEAVEKAIERLADNEFAQQFADLYRVAVGDSEQREVTLRCFAKWPSEDIYSGEIYPIAKHLNVSNPSQIKKQLTIKRYGSILEPAPGASERTVRFRNSLFKQYVNLRRSIYAGVKTKVDRGWREIRG